MAFKSNVLAMDYSTCTAIGMGRRSITNSMDYGYCYRVTCNAGSYTKTNPESSSGEPLPQSSGPEVQESGQ